MTEPRYFVEENDVCAFGFDWGRTTFTTSPTINGSSALSVAVASMNPGQGHARHNHPTAEEVIYVLSGSGEQMVEDEAGRPIVRAIGPGTTVYVPQGRFHSTLNIGDTPLKIFVAFSPSGSEDELRALPDFRLIQPGE
jgi:oxalate decarboxylase/phosphoglucose isomerase-like protein (cupin superfamily)